MSNTNPYIKLDRAIKDARKYGESVFLCYECAKVAEPMAASVGGRIIRSTEPNLPCGCCGEPNSRLEYRS